MFPGEEDESLLYLKLAAKTLGVPSAAELEALPGCTPMPNAPGAVAEGHLEALRLWIRAGAPESTVVAGTAALLDSCLPPASPGKMPQPDAPASDEGFQIAMPGYPLPHQSERELCVASFYDLGGLVPAEHLIDCPGAFPGTNDGHGGPDAGKCIAWNRTTMAQDPQSHHSIVRIYKGTTDVDDPTWGPWRCYLGTNDGGVCDPTVPSDCPDGHCGGDESDGVACFSFGGAFGPPDFGFAGFNGSAENSPQFSGVGEATGSNELPDGVHELLPVRGVAASWRGTPTPSI